MAPFLLVTDLDNTLVGDDNTMVMLNQVLDRERQQGTKLVYSTGRSLESYRRLQSDKGLVHPDLLVTAVGTEIYTPHDDRPNATWTAALADGWDRLLVQSIADRYPALLPQPRSEQRAFKVSYFLAPSQAPVTLGQLQAELQAQGLRIQLVYSSDRDLDILPYNANKGWAMEFVRQMLEFLPEHTIACGDSGNDIALFADRPELGIVVGNAQPELLNWHQANLSPHRYLTNANYAGGILEGLQHFGFLD